ncbi:MAG: hypothetical protein AAF555_09300 [Verrucomicrobiota bacterium]
MKTLPFFAAFLSLAGSAFAIDADEGLFAALDTNDDGLISRAEIAAASEVLLALDRNEDGVLAAAELDVKVVQPEVRFVEVKRKTRWFPGTDVLKDEKRSPKPVGARVLGAR